MADYDFEIGRLCEFLGNGDDPDSNIALLHRARLLPMLCDGSMGAISSVLRELCARLRRGDRIELPLDIPDIDARFRR